MISQQCLVYPHEYGDMNIPFRLIDSLAHFFAKFGFCQQFTYQKVRKNLKQEIQHKVYTPTQANTRIHIQIHTHIIKYAPAR